MSDPIFKYPLDLFGDNPDNKVVGEYHQIGVVKSRIFTSKYGPFFGRLTTVRDRVTGQALVPGRQFKFLHLYEEAQDRTGQPVYAAVQITDPTVSNEIYLDPHYVGGEFSYSKYAIIQAIKDLQLDSRQVAWGDLIGVPALFMPTPHMHNVRDNHSWGALVDAQRDTAAAIREGNTASMNLLIDQLNQQLLTLKALNDDIMAQYAHLEQRTDECIWQEPTTSEITASINRRYNNNRVRLYVTLPSTNLLEDGDWVVVRNTSRNGLYVRSADAYIYPPAEPNHQQQIDIGQYMSVASNQEIMFVYDARAKVWGPREPLIFKYDGTTTTTGNRYRISNRNGQDTVVFIDTGEVLLQTFIPSSSGVIENGWTCSRNGEFTARIYSGTPNDDLAVAVRGITEIESFGRGVYSVQPLTHATSGFSSKIRAVPDHLPKHVVSLDRLFMGNSLFNSGNIRNWDVGHVTSMAEMFRDAVLFNRDLSGWCVSYFPISPANFALGAAAWTLPKPLWGTCPGEGEDRTYVTVDQLESTMRAYSTTEQVEQMISSSAGSAVTTTQMNQAIASALQGYATQVWTSGQITGATSGMATQTWVGQQISSSLQGYATTEGVNSLMDQRLQNYSTTTQMNTAITTATNGFVTGAQVDTKISQATANFVTGTQVEGAISSALTGYATQTWVNNRLNNYVTGEALGTTLADYATTASMNTALNNYFTKAEINTQAQSYVRTSQLGNMATRDLHTGTSEPTAGTGKVGDIFFQYE